MNMSMHKKYANHWKIYVLEYSIMLIVNLEKQYIYFLHVIHAKFGRKTPSLQFYI